MQFHHKTVRLNLFLIFSADQIIQHKIAGRRAAQTFLQAIEGVLLPLLRFLYLGPRWLGRTVKG